MTTATADAKPKADPVAKIASDMRSINTELRTELVEREVEIDLALRSVIGKVNGLFIGEAGVAKSLTISRIMAHIDGAAMFEVLMAKDTPSEQVLGPVSLAALERDEFQRITKGKLPEAHLGFLDEIFKANSTVLNALLKIINERRFDNNGHSMDVPLWAVLGASNELPGTDRDDLRAFRDRFGFTKMVDHVRTSDGIKSVITGQLARNRGSAVAESHTTITVKDVEKIQQASANVKVPDSVLKGLTDLRARAESENLRISVRRMFEGVKLMQAAAALSDRDEVSSDDLRVFEHVLWSDPDDQKTAYELTLDYAAASTKKAAKLRAEYAEQQQALTDLQSEMPADGSVPEAELMGHIGRCSNMLKKLDERARSAVEAADEDGNDHSELDSLRADIHQSREHVKTLLGIGG